MADYQAVTETQGNLKGICPRCETIINRRVNPTKLEQIRGKLDITMLQAQPHINESAQPSVNSDLQEKAENHENSQSNQ